MKDLSKKQQVRSVVLLFLTAFFCAAVFAGYMIYRYGPSGSYVAGNTILAPFVVDQISFIDTHPTTGKKTKFVFNGVEFSYFDKMQEKRVTLPPDLYQRFYGLVQAEINLQSIPESIIREFAQNHPATLTITMRTDPSAAWQATKVFQMIQFTESDYFRVQLRDVSNQGTWVYFYHPHVYREIMHLFTTSQPL